MGFPTAIRRPRNRRALGRGQAPPAATIVVVVTGSASTVTFTFAEPVNVAGMIPITIATLTPVSQTIVSPTVVTQLQSGTVATHAWTLAQPVPQVSTYQGGQVVSVPSGTF